MGTELSEIRQFASHVSGHWLDQLTTARRRVSWCGACGKLTWWTSTLLVVAGDGVCPVNGCYAVSNLFHLVGINWTLCGKMPLIECGLELTKLNC